MNQVGILIVDDHAWFRRSLRSLIESRPDWRVCGEAEDGIDAVEKARKLRPNVVLMDVSMPRMDGLQATRVLRRELPDTGVILVSQNDPHIVSLQAAEAGARNFATKADIARRLPSLIDSIFSVRNHDLVRSVKTIHSPIPAFDGLFDSEMARLIQKTDWSKTPVGAPETWSPALRMMVNVLLANRMPFLLWWGPDYVQFYNDAYAPILGKKHPQSLGQPVRECWNEIWPILRPLIDTPFRGGPSTWSEDLELVLHRTAFLEETHFTVAYSPVPDSSAPGGIGGVLATVHEITAKVIGERRVAILRELASRSTEGRTAEEACRIAAETLARHAKDIPFAMLYLLEPDHKRARLAGAANVAGGAAVAPEFLDLSPEAVLGWPVSESLRDNTLNVVERLDTLFSRLPNSAWGNPPDAAVTVPVASSKPHEIRGLLICGVSPRLTLDEDYRTFFEFVAAQVATAIANAEAYEEERRRAEALAELDRAKTAFFSNISHEFRTPLTLMLSPLEDSLSSPEGLPPQHREHLELAHRNSLRLLKLVNALLDFSRIEAGRVQACYEATDLAQFTLELVSVFRSATERAGLRLLTHCPPISQPVYVDREMWEKIVFNLLSNAFKFTLNGEIEVSLLEKDGRAELAVRDTGTGIPQDELTHLFERFYRVKTARGRTFEGSGIGLSLVQELAKLHGGDVSVTSLVDQGSTFTVTIPLGKAHLPEERIGVQSTLASTGMRGDVYVHEALRWLPGTGNASPVLDAEIVSWREPLPEAAERKRARILLAEDNADMREYVERLLGQQYEVIAVADGESALDNARKHRPDLVLSDVMMPRLDGCGLVSALRADDELKSVPVILLSARAGEESRVEGLDGGADDYLVKPFSARELVARVGSHLSMARLRREALERERRMATEAAAASAKFRAVFEQTTVFAGIMNKDGVLIEANKMSLDACGYTAEEVIGLPFCDTPWWRGSQESQDKIRSATARALRGIPYRETLHYSWADGTERLVDFALHPILDGNGEVIFLHPTGIDVTDLKRTEESYRKLVESLDAEVRARTIELENRNVEILRQSDLLREFSQRLLHAQDEERRHIARELHDSAGQTLTVMGMNLATLTQKLEEAVPGLLEDAESIQELVQQLHREIRTTSYLLHPPLLDESGLASALNWYVQGLVERSDVNISLEISDDFGRLPRDLELVVFRLVQESLTNIHRHSGSKTAVIRIARADDTVVVEVIDRGQGMPPEKLTEIQSRGAGMGIRGMRERLRPFEGTMTIESDQCGTRILVNIPMASTVPDAEAEQLQKAV